MSLHHFLHSSSNFLPAFRSRNLDLVLLMMHLYKFYCTFICYSPHTVVLLLMLHARISRLSCSLYYLIFYVCRFCATSCDTLPITLSKALFRLLCSFQLSLHFGICRVVLVFGRRIGIELWRLSWYEWLCFWLQPVLLIMKNLIRTAECIWVRYQERIKYKNRSRKFPPMIINVKNRPRSRQSKTTYRLPQFMHLKVKWLICYLHSMAQRTEKCVLNKSLDWQFNSVYHIWYP